MGYTEQRDAALVHAKAAALATNSKWTDVAIGLPVYGSAKGVRLFYGGEREPVTLGTSRTLASRQVGYRVMVVAWWSLSGLNDSLAKLIEDEAHLFVHELRTRILGDSQLGGQSTDLEMEYAEPDIVVIGSTRFLTVETQLATDYTEYALAP